MYLAERLAATWAAITRIARGIPVGGDLEYADEVTLVRAMQGRRAFEAERAMSNLVIEMLLRLVKPAIALVLGAIVYWLATGARGRARHRARAARPAESRGLHPARPGGARGAAKARLAYGVAHQFASAAVLQSAVRRLPRGGSAGSVTSPQIPHRRLTAPWVTVSQ